MHPHFRKRRHWLFFILQLQGIFINRIISEVTTERKRVVEGIPINNFRDPPVSATLDEDDSSLRASRQLSIGRASSQQPSQGAFKSILNELLKDYNYTMRPHLGEPKSATEIFIKPVLSAR